MQSLLVEACWRPMEGDVAGDFHDVIDLTDGRVVVVIGDVAGVGLQAAEKADDLQADLHRVFRRTDDPTEAFRLLDERIARAGEDVFATMALAVVDPGSRKVNIASAGHPPILTANGMEARFLGGPSGPPLGIQAPRATTAHAVPSDAALFLYTDGLVERRRSSLQEALDLLLQVSRGLHGAIASAAELARRATARLGQPADDATVVSVRMVGDGAPLAAASATAGTEGRQRVVLRIYVDPRDLRSTRAESIVNELALQARGTLDFTIEVVDVSVPGANTERDGILAAPTVMRVSPPPKIRVVGSVQSPEELARALQLPIGQEER